IDDEYPAAADNSADIVWRLLPNQIQSSSPRQQTFCVRVCRRAVLMMSWCAEPLDLCQQALGFCEELLQITVYGARLGFLQQQFRITLDGIQWRAQIVA